MLFWLVNASESSTGTENAGIRRKSYIYKVENEIVPG